MTVAILVVLLFLAAANGANDVSKGVATLAGAGVTAYRTAILWGAATTLIGALLSIQIGRSMGKLFSQGIVSGAPTAAFALAVLLGTSSWVALATVARLPVSTTQAIVGSLVGAGLVLAPSSVQWSGVLQKVVLPLLLSIVVAYGISVTLVMAVQVGRRLRRTPQTELATVGVAPTGTGAAVPAPDGRPVTAADYAVPGPARRDLAVTFLHWASSGATGCARGLNDTPKIAAIGGFALLPAGYSATVISVIVAVAMAAGSLFGVRVARTLGEKVVRMSHTEGFTANATTACLVGAGAFLALPMSTTQVSTGAIVGSAGGQLSRISGRTLRDFAIAWTATPICAGVVAAIVFAAAG
ncbi:inorganic phosphate transporter [Micromonospora sp. NPDC049171]|uniref:inorganic phosphate transporter n=1 Tax=Micromonospora sp. NPDC049171 TaxID=3155770 RepID=UPI0033C2EAE2